MAMNIPHSTGDINNYTKNTSLMSLFSPNQSSVPNGFFRGNGNEGGLSVIIFSGLYSIICGLGLIGNGLVILVVLRFAKMKTAPNIYILNLAVSDLCFLIGLPFLITTGITRFWMFGFVMCKIFYILTSINWFASVFTLTVMSVDRYLAVCHALRSIQYRTPVISSIVCVCIWTLSFIVMLPIIRYTTTATGSSNKTSCTIIWPEEQPITSQKAFIWYTFLLGYAIPVAIVVVLYALVLSKVKTLGPKGSTSSTREKRVCHRKVTRLVLIVVAVYIVCWLPYWVFQMELTINSDTDMPPWKVFVFQLITCLSYTNSMLNPVIYAFLSENFRDSFTKAFKCDNVVEINTAFHAEYHNANQACLLSRDSPNESRRRHDVTHLEVMVVAKNIHNGESAQITVFGHDNPEIDDGDVSGPTHL